MLRSTLKKKQENPNKLSPPAPKKQSQRQPPPVFLFQRSHVLSCCWVTSAKMGLKTMSKV